MVWGVVWPWLGFADPRILEFVPSFGLLTWALPLIHEVGSRLIILRVAHGGLGVATRAAFIRLTWQPGDSALAILFCVIA